MSFLPKFSPVGDVIRQSQRAQAIAAAYKAAERYRRTTEYQLNPARYHMLLEHARNLEKPVPEEEAKADAQFAGSVPPLPELPNLDTVVGHLGVPKPVYEGEGGGSTGASVAKAIFEKGLHDVRLPETAEQIQRVLDNLPLPVVASDFKLDIDWGKCPDPRDICTTATSASTSEVTMDSLLKAYEELQTLKKQGAPLSINDEPVASDFNWWSHSVCDPGLPAVLEPGFVLTNTGPDLGPVQNPAPPQTAVRAGAGWSEFVPNDGPSPDAGGEREMNRHVPVMGVRF